MAEIDGNTGDTAAPPPVLAVSALTKRFGALVASDNVTLDLWPGEIHALIGPNGAGKSTLIKQIAGELTPDAGAVHLAGEDVTGWPAPARVHAGLARTFQVSALALEMTARQNVMLALGGIGGRAFHLFRVAARDGDLAEQAGGYLDAVGLSGRSEVAAGALSHGERRLLELAIALALQPKAFLLDEPMAGLGTTGSRELTAFLADLRHTAPILLVEHDMDAVFALADRISVLVYGRVIATGTPDAIRANPDVQDAYLGEAVA